MPVFAQQLRRIDEKNPQTAVKQMANHIRYIQEQLEYTLMNLDSRNVIEIDTDKTAITDSSGNTSIGSYISLSGANGESFRVGKNKNGQFEFVINGKGGTQTLYLDSTGDLIITKHANITIDGGEW